MGAVKQKRTAEQIRILLSDLLRLEVSDPRLQGLTVTQVTLDRELQHADVHVNALGDEGRQDEVLAALEKAQSFIRHELSQRLRLRKTPLLHFHWDLSLQRAVEIDALLDSIHIPEEPADEESPADDA
jgi:ribosome-binding factor A